MRYLQLFLMVTIVSILSSCGEETSDTPTNPPSNTLFTWDTLSALKEAGGSGVVTVSQSFAQTITATQVKVEYRLQSNVDSALGCRGSYKDSTNGTGTPSPVNYNIYAPVDSAMSFTWNVSTQPYYSGFGANLIVSAPQSVTRYVRLVNIKVTKVQ